MHISIFGATGGTGLALTRQAIDAGCDVTVLVRDASRMSIDSPRIRIYQGDALDGAAVENALAGADAVLCCLGQRTRPWSNLGLLSQATRIIIGAMKKRGIRRFVCESSLGVGEGYERVSAPAKLIFATLLRGAFADKAVQETEIENSGLDWVIVRPGFLTNGPRTGNYRAEFGRKLGLGNRISREDVAEFMLKQVTGTEYLHKTVELVGAR